MAYFDMSLEELKEYTPVFATYNQIKTDKKIDVYDFNQHEGGQDEQTVRKMAYLNDHWGKI